MCVYLSVCLSVCTFITLCLLSVRLWTDGLAVYEFSSMVFPSLTFSHCRYALWLLLYIVDLVKLLFYFFLFFASFHFHATINGE